MYQSIINAEAVVQLLASGAPLLLFDCRHDLFDTDYGRRAYGQGHIPTSYFLHVDEDLSGPIVAGVTGRHPLPKVAAFEATMQRFGLHPALQVVAYDDKGGGIAARLWWLLRWLGHEKVAVLDGGFSYWQAQGFAVERQPTNLPAPSNWLAQPQISVPYFDFDALVAAKDNLQLIDSRTADRYSGEVENIDPVAGHIPGASNLPWPANLAADGRFLDADTLKSRFFPVLEEAAQPVFYCGSGVTACHNILAFYHATGQFAALYPGSWSEWIVKTKQITD